MTLKNTHKCDIIDLQRDSEKFIELCYAFEDLSLKLNYRFFYRPRQVHTKNLTDHVLESFSLLQYKQGETKKC